MIRPFCFWKKPKEAHEGREMAEKQLLFKWYDATEVVPYKFKDVLLQLNDGNLMIGYWDSMQESWCDTSTTQPIPRRYKIFRWADITYLQALVGFSEISRKEVTYGQCQCKECKEETNVQKPS